VHDFGAISSSGPPSYRALTGSTATLAAATRYWMAVLTDATTTLQAQTNASAAQSFVPIGYDGSNPSGIQPGWAWRVSQSYGSLPSSFPGSASIITVATARPLIYYRWAT